MDFKGEFETHVTTELEEARQWHLLSSWCTARHLKCVHIVLDRGVTASQPMFTRQGVGTFESEFEIANQLCEECEKMGLRISRLKMEVPPWNEGVPQSENEALLASKQQYFEHHIKILLPVNCDLNPLRTTVIPHGAHLSRNARRIRQDGFEERFVTQRCRGVAEGEAHSQLLKLRAELESFGITILEMEEEYVVFDSNLALDDGWIEKSGAK